MLPGKWELDSYLVDLTLGKVTNVTGIERVSHYNGGLFFMPGGKRLVSGSDDGSAIVWNVDGTGDLIKVGNRLFAAGQDRIAGITLPAAGKKPLAYTVYLTFFGGTGAVRAYARLENPNKAIGSKCPLSRFLMRNSGYSFCSVS